MGIAGGHGWRRQLVVRGVVGAAAFLWVCGERRAEGYIDMAPTLARLIKDAKSIAVVEVVEYDREGRVVVLRPVKTLKGDAPAEEIRHEVSFTPTGPVDRRVVQWATPGEQAVVFSSPTVTLVCLGTYWYSEKWVKDVGWKLAPERPGLSLAYYGRVTPLADAVELMLADQDAVITTVAFSGDNEGASFDLALNRQNLPGIVRVQRTWANTLMPLMVGPASVNAEFYIGTGAVGEEDIPRLMEKLKAADMMQRAEAAEALRSLGRKAKVAGPALLEMMKVEEVRVRFAAATAVLQILPRDKEAAARAMGILNGGLSSGNVAMRRAAARAAGYAGGAGAKGEAVDAMVSMLARLLKDEDEVVRINALESISMLGPVAGKAADAVMPLLENAELAVDAADALGRMGAAARGAQGRLAEMLKSEDAAVRWAAVRGMSQIGGPEARPAVQFMMKALPTATDVEWYNMLVYFSLIGPDAAEASDVIAKNRKGPNPILPVAVQWALAPEKGFPWTGGGGMALVTPATPANSRGVVTTGSGLGGLLTRLAAQPTTQAAPRPTTQPVAQVVTQVLKQSARTGFGPAGPVPAEALQPAVRGTTGAMTRPTAQARIQLDERMYRSYFHELGVRLRPAAKVLAERIIEDTAGKVPVWGYKILEAGPDLALEVLLPHVRDEDVGRRERAVVALAYMGEAAEPAKEVLEGTLKEAGSERERMVLGWCLRKIEEGGGGE